MSGRGDQSNVVSFDRGRRTPDPARVREFAELGRRLERERGNANETVAGLLRDTPRDRWPALVEAPELRTSAAVTELATAVRQLIEQNPRDAVVLSSVATTIAETLPPDSYPPVVIAQLRANAWKDRANALCYVARYDEALEALARAESILEEFAGVTVDRAIVRLSKAIALQSVDRFEESFALMRECSAVFTDFGDSRRLLQCGIAHGTALYRCGAWEAARDIFEPLFQTARELNDLESEARLHNNIGYCEAQLGDIDSASRHFTDAAKTFHAAGLTVEALRVERGAGTILVRKGESERGLRRLTDARRRFLIHGMVEEAGLCGLDVVEALLARRDSSAAEALAREIAEQFTNARLNKGAVAALAYLGQAIEQRQATPSTVRYIQDYVVSLRHDPARAFVAMPA